MAITRAHEGVFKHPTYPALYVVDPARAASPSHPEWAIERLRAAADERTRGRRTRTIVIFVVTVVVAYAILSLIGYNAFSSVLIAIGAGIVACSIVLPLLYRPGQSVDADAVIEAGAALPVQSLDTYGVPVDDTTPWPVLWRIAGAYAVADDEEATLDELEYFFDEERPGAADVTTHREMVGLTHPVTEADVERQRTRFTLALAEADSLAMSLGYRPAARPTERPNPLTDSRPGDDLI